MSNNPQPNPKCPTCGNMPFYIGDPKVNGSIPCSDPFHTSTVQPKPIRSVELPEIDQIRALEVLTDTYRYTPDTQEPIPATDAVGHPVIQTAGEWGCPICHITYSGSQGRGDSKTSPQATNEGQDPTPPRIDAAPNPIDPYNRVMALPERLRVELNYLAFMKPEKSDEFYHNIAVAGERIQALITAAGTNSPQHEVTKPTECKNPIHTSPCNIETCAGCKADCTEFNA